MTYLVSFPLCCEALEFLCWQIPKQQSTVRVRLATNGLWDVTKRDIDWVCLLSATEICQVCCVGCEYDWKDCRARGKEARILVNTWSVQYVRTEATELTCNLFHHSPVHISSYTCSVCSASFHFSRGANTKSFPYVWFSRSSWITPIMSRCHSSTICVKGFPSGPNLSPNTLTAFTSHFGPATGKASIRLLRVWLLPNDNRARETICIPGQYHANPICSRLTIGSFRSISRLPWLTSRSTIHFTNSNSNQSVNGDAGAEPDATFSW
jgi:hypothetical protein